MNKTNDYKFNLPAYSDPVDIEDLNDNFRGIDDALMAGLCKKDYTGNNMGSSDPSARKYAWAPWLEIVNDNEFDVVVTDRNAPVESEEATINVAAGQTFRKYINGRYYMNFYVQDQHDVTFKWFTNAETYINESGGGGGGTGTVTSVSVQGGSGSHLTASGNPIETSGTITIDIDDGYSIPSDNEQTAWDGKAADLKAEIDSSTYVLTLQLKDSAGNLIGTAKTIDLPLETMVVDGEYDSQTKKIKLELKNGNYVEFSVADLVSGLQTELSASNKLGPDYIDYDSSHRAVSDTEKDTWNAKQNAIDSDHKLSSSLVSFSTAEAAALASGIDSSKVGQISTNQTNILYALQTGVKNIIQLNPGTYTNNVATFTVSNDGEVIVNAGSAGTSAITIGEFELPAGDYKYWYDVTASSGKCDVRLMNGATRLASEFTLSSATTIHADVYSYAVNSNTVIKPMLCTANAWAQEPNVYRPPALPNYDLTRLESEDRAALAEVVDSGAKNLLNCDNATIAVGAYPDKITYTRSGNTITVTSTGAPATTGITISDISNIVPLGVPFIISGCPSGGGDDTYRIDYFLGGSYVAEQTPDTGSGSAPIIITNASRFYIRIRVAAGAVFTNKVFKLMVCTKAAFDVSNKFVPYRPNYDLVCNRYNSTCLIKTYEYTPTAADTYEELPLLKITLPSGKMLRITASAIFQVAYAKGIMLIRGNTVGDTYTLAKQESDTGLNTLAVSTAYTAGSAQDIHVYVKANSKAAIKVVVVYDII